MAAAAAPDTRLFSERGCGLKALVQNLARREGYTLRRRVVVPVGIPDRELYDPFFQPWHGADFQRIYGAIRSYSLVSPEAANSLYAVAQQARHLAAFFANKPERTRALTSGPALTRSLPL